MRDSRLTLRETLALKRGVRPRPEEAAPGPFLKWVGGKTKLLPELALRAPRTFGRYFEPFVGGGALFFKLRPPAAMLSDTNVELVNAYRAVRNDVDGVIRALTKHRKCHRESYYYDVRSTWNEQREAMSPAERAATLLYLNKTCYNGLWRVNRRGDFNVPAGRYANPTILAPETLRAASRVLRAADLVCDSFAHVLSEARAGDFVYFDPPYDPVSPTANFTSYTSDSFTADDQRHLADVFRKLADRGCAVMLSNSDTPFIRRLYAGFQVDRVYCARAINSDPASRGAVAEVIVTNPY